VQAPQDPDWTRSCGNEPALVVVQAGERGVET